MDGLETRVRILVNASRRAPATHEECAMCIACRNKIHDRCIRRHRSSAPHATINWHINSTNLNNNAISGSFKITDSFPGYAGYCLKEILFNSIIYNATRVRLSVMYASTILIRRRNIITFRRTCSYMSYR